MHTPQSDIDLIRRVLAAIADGDQARIAPIVAIANRAIELLHVGPFADRHVAELCTELRAYMREHERGFGYRAARALFDVVCAAVEAPDRVAALEMAVPAAPGSGVVVGRESGGHSPKVTESSSRGESVR